MPARFEMIGSTEHAVLLVDSYLRVVGQPLLPDEGTATELARALYLAPFVVLSHGVEPDPIFRYGNAAAQSLFEFEWDDLVRLPSRLSAEPMNRAERQRLLDAVASRGFIDDYAGVRVSRSGRRFRIEQATVWNVVDARGTLHGQAATFSNWSPLEGRTI